jgi:UDP-2-acetamido-3-amino-2,3-dideoxy-glucuronate N-acetyltransferase
VSSHRVACIGAGHWGKNLVRNFAELGALAAVCEADPARRQALEAQYPEVGVTGDVDALLRSPEIDAVVIATPAETHAGLVRRALAAGKHVFVEKPLALSVEEGEELVASAERRGRVLMVGHLLWYHPAVLRLKEIIDEGELGRIQYIYSNRLNLGKIRTEENILWSFAPHDVSVMLGLVGEMPDAVDAHGGTYLREGVADVTVSTLSFPSGVKGHIFVSWLHPFKEQKLVVVGDRKMAVFNDVEPTDKLVVYPHSIDWKKQIPVATAAAGLPVSFEGVEPLRLECEHFLRRIADGAAPRTDGREALRVLRVLAALQRRLELGNHGKTALDAPTTVRPRHRVHESSYVDEDVEIGEGTTIWHFSHVLRNCRIGAGCRIGQNVVIGPNVQIGDGVKIQNNVSVYEGVTLEDDVFCGPSMVFTNVYNPRSEIRRMDELRRTLVRKGATFGANCTVVCGITVGRYAFVGAGAVVLRDVPDHALVVGNPGRIVGWMCSCGSRIDFEGEDGTGVCRACGSGYEKVGAAVQPVSAAAHALRPEPA